MNEIDKRILKRIELNKLVRLDELLDYFKLKCKLHITNNPNAEIAYVLTEGLRETLLLLEPRAWR